MSGVVTGVVGLSLIGAGVGAKALRSNQLRRQQGRSAFSQQQMAAKNMIETVDPVTGDTIMVPAQFAELAASRENLLNQQQAASQRNEQMAGIQNQYQNLAQQGLPDAVERGMEQNIQQGTNQLLRGLQASRSGLRGLSGVASQQNQSYQNLAMMDAQARQSATQNYLNFQNQASAEQYGMQQDQIGLNNAFAAQQLGIYNQGQDQINALYGAAQQNMNEGWNTVGDVFGAAGNIVGAGNFGKGGGDISPMTPKSSPNNNSGWEGQFTGNYDPNASVSNFIPQTYKGE